MLNVCLSLKADVQVITERPQTGNNINNETKLTIVHCFKALIFDSKEKI